MARDFNGSTQYGTYATNVDTTLTTYTVAAWINTDTTTGAHAISAQRHNASPGTAILFQLDHNNTDARFIVRDNAGAIANATKAGAIASTGVWYHCVGTRNGGTVEVSVDGGTVASASATFGSISNATTRTVGANGSSSGIAGFFDGRVAEVAVWDAVLTDAERISLANGLPPLLVRPASLLSVGRFLGAASPETDLLDSGAITLTASPAAASHPRVFYPARRQFRYGVTAAATAFAPYWYRQHVAGGMTGASS